MGLLSCTSELSEGSLSSGPATFVFTDIEGSTLRWELHASAMRVALRRHDMLVREALRCFGGVIFTTAGDAFCAVFTEPLAGVRAAIAVQRALSAEDFSAVDGLYVRIAVHTGYAEAREGNYFGASVNRVARLLAIGHGRQILVSRVTTELLADAPATEFDLLDLGEHRLKDLLRAEHVFQVLAPGLPVEFAHLRSLHVLANNLPLQITSFVGREYVVAEVTELQRHHRLLTLTGAGGVGKSRLSLQVAANLVDGSGQGVWLVELASLQDPELVPIAVAAAVGIALPPDADPVTAVVAALRTQKLLLVFDNCEHLIEAVARVVMPILRTCPDVAILASSRQPLGIAGEATYRVPSLNVPNPEEAARITAVEAIGFGAIQLFAERARDADRRFELTDLNAPVVAEICLRLDGIALATELAAARVRILSPVQIRDRLDERFRLLIGGDRTTLPRQRTLGALIDWSYDLLDAREQRVLCRLSFLNGSFTLAAAEAVAGEGADLFDTLAALSDKSLLSPEASDNPDAALRFRLSESIRLYASQKISDEDERERLSRRVVAWGVATAEAAFDAWARLPSEVWRIAYEPELENLRACLSHTLELRTDVEAGQRLAAMSRRFWGRVAPTEGLHWMALARRLEHERTPPELTAALVLSVAHMHVALSHHELAFAAASEALETFGTAGDAVALGESLTFAGYALAGLGQPSEAKPYLLEATALFRLHGERQLTAHALHDLAFVQSESEQFEEARELYRAAFDEFAAIANRRGMHAAMANLAEIDYRVGDVEAAVRTVSAASALETDPRDAAHSLANGASYLIALGRWDEALAMARDSFANSRKVAVNSLGRPEATRFLALQRFAAITALRNDVNAAAIGDLREAAKTLGYVDERLAELSYTRIYSEEIEYERTRLALGTLLGTAEFERLHERGRRSTTGPTIDLASYKYACER